jgi:4-amino-4-deoxy-L-arabinose transferase-like glycosyltransferase
MFERARRGTSLLALCYIFTGLAVLAKGLVGLAFPVAVVALFFLLSRRRPPRALIASLLWGIPLVVLIAGPWHVAMYWKYGSEFVDIYFVQHHFERFTSNRYLHPQPVYFFWWVLPLLALPWVLFTPSGIAAARRQGREAGPSLSLFSICWLLVPLTFFSFSGSKLPGYILPSVPPIVILAWTWARIGQTRRALSTAMGWLTLGIALAVIWAWLPAYADRDSVKPLVAAADAMGYKDSRVLTLHMVSHNAEFYAAGRLLRDEQGGQAKLEGAQLVLDEINKDGRPVLVLVPVEYTPQLTEYSKVTTKVLAENAGVAIVAVAAK